jgi:hypothetical protein
MVSEIETQSNGIVAIIDVKDFAFQQARQFTPPLIKIITEIIQVKLNSKQNSGRFQPSSLLFTNNAERVSYSFTRNSCSP